MNNVIRLNGRSVLSAALCLALGVSLAPSVLAQDAEEETALEEVIITGSRIRQDPLEERLPVLSLSEEDYRATGASSLAEFVQKLPISGSAINQSNNSSGNLGFPPDGGGIGAGAAEIDLRYLTSKRVLVLVDGRRWIKGSSGSGVSGAVDLNSIPVNAVKSIEILQDGASAVYGSDAIGGVLNIITQDDFDSLKASAYYGQYNEGDGETAEVDVRFGARGERGRALVDISWADQKAVNTQDRDESVYALPGFPHGISSGTPAGRFVFLDPTVGDYVSVAPNAGIGDSPVWNPADPDNDDFHGFGLDDRFAYQPYNHLITPNERLNIFAKAEYDLSEKTMLRVLASYNNRKSQGRAAPVPLFFGVGGGSTFYMANLIWPADHPYNPFGVDLGPDTLDFIGRRPVEAGPRIFNQDVDTWYVSAGVDGEFELGGRDMFWDVTAIFSENDAKQTKLNQFNARRLYTALGPTDVCAANVGCVPLNIVGEGAMTQEMLDYVTYTGVDTSSQELFDFSANLAGSLFDMPAGALGFAIGFEHREEDGAFVPDPVVAAGETADVPTSPTTGSFDVDELYGEIIVPILADRKGADVLNVSAALRYSDYNLFDSETVGKLALNWGPTSNLMLRASYSEGFRAPNIGELFNLGSRFDAGISDRCSNVAPADAANCAALGVPPDYEQLNPQISVDTGGNRDLVPETSDTFTAGFSWDTPMDNVNAIDSFLVEFNYYDVQIDGAIQAPRAQDLLNACIDTLDDLYCNAVNRLPSGTITSIGGVLQNIGGIETDGIDINLDLGMAETGIGRFRFQWMTSILLSYDELVANASGGLDRLEREGTEVGSPTRGYPDTKSTVNTDWMLGDWSARLSLRYISSLTEQCTGLVADFEEFQLCSNGPDTNNMSSRLYTDTQVSWAPSQFDDGRWTFTLGVNNLFDERPPICYSCDLNSLDGTLYPIGGQFWYLRAIFEM
jgi:iron complex outermembrane receptor protein